MPSEPTPVLMAISLFAGAALLCGYIAAAYFLTRKVWGLSEGNPDWVRVLAGSVVLAVFFAPAVVGAGHGVSMGPAWVALVDPNSNRFLVRIALSSLVGSLVTFFAIGTIARSIQKRRAKQ